ncbi:Rha family transcriptional regulator [Paralcaligenes ureilyticus]|uniref:Phage regulator Rha-like protein n=1 Tax=Paralcaligenes ureilyticus TaxID=627131 RepID=A0A4R3M8M0_9BURK|nr:Rha family transcriptional regulator [Paralcaligenes ureilyticus]TCT09476.1 phage regulator Rha-like protein [Paralcaligenes ureilyticus]
MQKKNPTNIVSRAGIRLSANGSQSITLAGNSEPRVDSRLIAQHLGLQHKSVFNLVRDYAADFREFDQLRFENSLGKRQQGGGNPERYALLTEDQAYLLLSYSRNTKRVRELKVNLVKAFREARQGIDITQTEYLPTYKALHDGFHELAAHSSNERLVHINVNKLINKTVGIGPGERQHLPVPHKSLLVAAQFMAARAINGASDHRDGYARAKQALATLQVPALGSAL